MNNFTLIDLLQSAAATFAFAVFFLPVGYLLGFASNLLGFRDCGAAEKLLFSTVYSVAVMPAMAVLLTRFASATIANVIFLLLALIAAAILVKNARPTWRLPRTDRDLWIMLGMGVAWIALVLLSVADLQIGQRLYVSYLAYDHSVRVPLVEAVARTGVPPRNPFYGIGTLPTLRYFYYWYVVCSLPMRLFGLSARGCLNGSIVWSGICLASVIPLFLKHFCGEVEDLRKKSVIGVGLLTITGLDLLPYLLIYKTTGVLLPDLEWWDTSQISSWLGSLLWVPHHVAALTVCMVGLLTIAGIEEEMSTSHRAWAVALSGFAFASAAGLSLYVAFTFVIFAIGWSLFVLWQGKFKTLASYAVSGGLAVLISLPYLKDLTEPGGGPSGSSGILGSFASFGIRDDAYLTELFSRWGVDGIGLALIKIPMLVILYFLEFGFFALVTYLTWKRDRTKPPSRNRKMMWVMLATCLLTLSFLQSKTSGANDLGFRGMLVAQFVLLLWAVPVVYEYFFRGERHVRSNMKLALGVTIGLGLAATCYQLGMLRSYTPMADAGKLTRSESVFGAPGFAGRTYWIRDAFAKIDRRTPSSAVVQYNPIRFEVLLMHLYSGRQAAMGDESCNAAFGGDLPTCQLAYPDVSAMFNDPNAVRGWDIDSFCSNYNISLLVASEADPVWQDPASWVWQRPVLYANPAVRVISCGRTPPRAR